MARNMLVTFVLSQRSAYHALPHDPVELGLAIRQTVAQIRREKYVQMWTYVDAIEGTRQRRTADHVDV